MAPVSTGEEADGEGPTAATDPDHHGACAPYYYPSCVDGRIPAGEKFAGDFGPRAGSDLCPIRDIDDYEVYFSFAMSSRTAEDIAGYDEVSRKEKHLAIHSEPSNAERCGGFEE